MVLLALVGCRSAPSVIPPDGCSPEVATTRRGDFPATIRVSRPGVRCDLRLDTLTLVTWKLGDTLAQGVREVVAELADGSLLATGYEPGVVYMIRPGDWQIRPLTRNGSGPGELAGHPSAFPVTGADSVLLVENSMRWHVVTSRGYEGLLPVRSSLAGVPRRICFGPRGQLFATALSVPELQPSMIGLLDRDFNLKDSIQSNELAWPRQSLSAHHLWCARDGGVFAVADRDRSDGTLTLIRWAPSAKKATEVRIDLPWFRGGEFRDVDLRNLPDSPLPSGVMTIQDLGDDRLLIAVRTDQEGWRHREGESPDELIRERFDVVLVMVDLAREVVLGEVTIDDPATFPIAINSRSGKYFVVEQREDGTTLQSVTLALSQPAGTPSQ